MGKCCSDENDEELDPLLGNSAGDENVPRKSESRTSESLKDSLKSQKGKGPEAELVLSEKRYVKKLKTLHDGFLTPLFHKKIFPKTKQKLFSNLSIIYKFHRNFLKDLMSSKDIPGVFLAQADFFLIYVQYVENYNLILDCLAEFRENPQFVALTEEMKQKNLHFESLLIEPIQRIPRYELLLKEMIRSCNETDLKHEKLNKALDKVHGVAQILNERKREFEKLARMSYIASRIHGLPKSLRTIYHPLRKFIDEQKMKRRSKYNENQQRPCWCLLFSDVLITTDLSYKFKRLVELRKITSSLLVQRFNGLIFRVDIDPDLYLFCDDLDTAKDWIGKVRITRERFLSQTNSRISILTKRSCRLISVESSDMDYNSQQESIPNLSTKKAEDLPIQPVSSSGLLHHSHVPRTNNMNSSTLDSNNVKTFVSEHESSTAASKVQNYDDYNI